MRPVELATLNLAGGGTILKSPTGTATPRRHRPAGPENQSTVAEWTARPRIRSDTNGSHS